MEEEWRREQDEELLALQDREREQEQEQARIPREDTRQSVGACVGPAEGAHNVATVEYAVIPRSMSKDTGVALMQVAEDPATGASLLGGSGANKGGKKDASQLPSTDGGSTRPHTSSAQSSAMLSLSAEGTHAKGTPADTTRPQTVQTRPGTSQEQEEHGGFQWDLSSSGPHNNIVVDLAKYSYWSRLEGVYGLETSQFVLGDLHALHESNNTSSYSPRKEKSSHSRSKMTGTGTSTAQDSVHSGARSVVSENLKSAAQCVEEKARRQALLCKSFDAQVHRDLGGVQGQVDLTIK